MKILHRLSYSTLSGVNFSQRKRNEFMIPVPYRTSTVKWITYGQKITMIILTCDDRFRVVLYRTVNQKVSWLLLKISLFER